VASFDWASGYFGQYPMTVYLGLPPSFERPSNTFGFPWGSRDAIFPGAGKIMREKTL
jgi:hypothetical protein